MSRRRVLVAALFLLLALPFIFHRQILSGIGHYIVSASGPKKADAALVLAGDIRGNRIRTASQLVRNGFVPVVLVSGPMEWYGINEATLAIDFAVRQGDPASWYVPVFYSATSTLSEATALPRILRSRNIRRLLIVTSNFHTRRAGSIFRRKLPGDIEISMIAAPDPYFTPEGWWQNREGQKTVFFEVSKTIADWIGL
ncbi:MAG TPA: YdcF family protein [Bryobacteraceae bacterium]|nr:YdcF family protein [Bryobacteraceae bacterium]